MIIKYQVKRKKYESQLKKTISFAAAAVMLSAGSQSAFAEEAVFPESSQEQTASGEEYEPAEPIDDLIIDDSSAENSSTAESDDSYDSYDSAEESIADEQQAQKSESIYIAAVSAPTLSIEKTNKTTIRIAWNTQDCYSYIVERRLNGGN